MKISSVNYSSYNVNKNLYSNSSNSYYKDRKTDDSVFLYSSQPSFTGNLKPNFVLKFWENIKTSFLQKEIKVSSIKDYLKLKENEIAELRVKYNELEKISPELKMMEQIHTYIANGIKQIFDERFGAEKYKIILIGRSLSTFGVSLESILGEDNVIDIPMSNARRFCSSISSIDEYEKFQKKLKKDIGLKSFQDYLATHQLSKNQIKNKDKSYIIMDYAWSGDSLKGAEQLFRSDIIWGPDNKNVYVVDFMSLIENLDELRMYKSIASSKEDKHIFKNIARCLCENYYKQFARVEPSFFLKDIWVCNDVMYDEEQNLVLFNLIDKILNQSNKYDILVNKNKKLNETNVRILPVFNQKVEIWQDAISAYENDLRNDINLMKSKLIIIKNLDKKGVNSNPMLKDNYTKLFDLYKKYLNYYQNIDIREHRCEYYKNRAEIDDYIKCINV